MAKSKDEFSADETAKRRDEVIRRMANTPPQTESYKSSSKKEKESCRGSRGS
jgi:hypothetical protein